MTARKKASKTTTAKPSSNTARRKSAPPKGVFPPQLVGKSFRDHPEWINRKGRPKYHDEFRAVLRDLGSLNSNIFIEVDGQQLELTRMEALALSMMDSRDPRDKQTLFEHMFGKAPNAISRAEEPDAALTGKFTLPVDLIAPDFVDLYRDINQHRHTEYLVYGGRGSTKSTFISLAIIYLIINNPDIHALATRQVKDTMRDSIYGQLLWAINELGVNDKFKCTMSPMQMEYLPTHQTIYFRGADDPGKLKSVKPTFGYIGILWFEELDQFHGPEAIRKIEQSVIRGGEQAWIFKSFNPPRTSGNWVNKYVLIPKESQFQHRSDYRRVPKEWLGQVFLDEAEHLRTINPPAYDHEYLGVVNGTGGQVFDNVKLKKLTDKEIGEFERIQRGIDWGFFPDPFAYTASYYDPARLTLYIFDEMKALKQSNRKTYDALISSHKLKPEDLIIGDSAEPKSVADYREYGATIRAAEKGPASVEYSIKWLQSLAAIIIDPVRCPETAQEFTDYELEQDKNGEYISAYPDKNNHFIDSVRYANNLVWRRRGQ